MILGVDVGSIVLWVLGASVAVNLVRAIVFDGAPGWLRGAAVAALDVAIVAMLRATELAHGATRRAGDAVLKLCSTRERLRAERRI